VSSGKMTAVEWERELEAHFGVGQSSAGEREGCQGQQADCIGIQDGDEEGHQVATGCNGTIWMRALLFYLLITNNQVSINPHYVHVPTPLPPCG
jgi:hypothetical protein